MSLKVYNTLTRRKEKFIPLKEKIVNIYVCGPTVYDHTHLGHARTYIAFDVIIRFLEYLGYKVRYVRNITDVGHLSGETLEGEDKLVKGAKKEKKTPWEIADKYMMEFFKLMDELGVRRPDYQPKASQMIPDMIKIIQKLIEKGYAYETETGVYFDVSKFEGYGKLSRIKKEDLEKHRIEPDPTKKNSADFALWKKVSGGYPLKWDSPWGEGFPGWHIECSAMALKFLGEQIDIHGGAKDLIFPHHENEIAQSEAYTGKKPFAKYWLHTGFLTINGEKMSKSKGNFIILKDALKKYDPEVLRMFFISSHYRSDIDFNEKAINDARAKLERIYNCLEMLDEIIKQNVTANNSEEFINKIKSLKEEFIEAMKDDFNTPLALAKLMEIVSESNKFFKENKDSNAAKFVKETILELGKIFGLFQKKREKHIDSSLTNKLIELILNVREELRKRKLYEISDKIRKELKNLGIIVYDTPDGPKYRFEETKSREV